ncbi:sodium:solute symporter family protein [Clostridium luticellarii]|jgi:SSS family solute:Na+ symporter|uniref:Sodium/proline symporter n=1 Tax=Clostridium luticellarii TaxID=1691940 RepID=A0A2T0BM95_9CLOT|nr:sodium:solute symporter family protein [Clostridium luticellarii]MCI1945198.1 sodium:solute symporter family protein [Clostridium luticellarii]MCI1968840.1 sodium:solute symporter family protein [Clostridium luticellarii]MCI1995626.1 sodium:solute symporter family protein [Clostridium luticellarii]MCI2040014.1 sodium:solute symporter family protein [Clostridium luticellarii]PRR85007.1 Sodium/proline symporter [Clostridium luticellarii]
MNISLIIIILYISMLFVISFFARKRALKGGESYTLAGRQLTTPLVTCSLIGLAIGGASTIGVAEQAYNIGMSAGWYNVAWGFGAIVMGISVAGKYREFNVSTVPELFGKFYDEKGRIICVVCQIIILLIIVSLQYIAGGSILSSLLPGVFTLKTGMIISACVFIGITFIGGMWSAGLCNMFNVPIKYAGIILCTILAVVSTGGFQNIKLHLPQNINYFSPVEGTGIWIILSWFLIMITQVMSMQGPVQLAFAAKDSRTARRGFIIAGLLMIPIGFLCAIIGIAAKTAFPDVSATLALPKMILSLNPVAAGLTLAALWAADVSTACNLLLGASTLFTQDIYKSFVNPKIDSEKLIVMNKIFVVLIGILTFMLALSMSGILKTISIGLSLCTSFTIVFLFTVFIPKLCRKSSAFYTTLASILVLFLWQIMPSFRIFPHVIFMEWLVCLCTFMLISLLDKRTISMDNQNKSIENII